MGHLTQRSSFVWNLPSFHRSGIGSVRDLQFEAEHWLVRGLKSLF